MASKKKSPPALFEQLAERLSERIIKEKLAAGKRLQSVRECATQQNVSTRTVVAAYELLVAKGVLEARAKRGFYVRDKGVRHEASLKVPDTVMARNLTMRASSLMRGMFHRSAPGTHPGAGVLPVEWLETSFLAAALRKAAAGDAFKDVAFRYGEPMGDLGLREALSRRLTDFAIPASAEQIMTTSGATHALDIVSRTLLRAGDAVMVEEPGWSIEFARLSSLGMKILPVPRGVDGPDLEVMEQHCRKHQPQLFVSVSVFHNPTGLCLTPGSAHRILQLAERYGFFVVEDDTYSHLASPMTTRLSALDGLKRTIYVSGFSKVLVPNWRVGFLAAPAALTDVLVDTKLMSTLSTPSLFEKALAQCIEQGQLRRHSDRLRLKLDAARARTVSLATAQGFSFAAEPAGMFGWVETGKDTAILAQAMLARGFVIAPGALFFAGQRSSTLMRVNFATAQNISFWIALREAAAAIL